MVPIFARRLCDDAAVFPPGLTPLAEAVPAHAAHRTGPYGDLVGPPHGPGQMASEAESARRLPVDLATAEVAVPTGMGVPEFVTALDRACAAAIAAVAEAHVPFRATAGLHHAVRNTDARTGFEQHGFLNLLLATAAEAVRGLGEDRAAAVRRMVVSFGTCSITEPLAGLVDMGLAPASIAPGKIAHGEGATA
ncbi:hypothetical protein Acsp03_68680 [Actinomadura sp. NBRC 104412]|uniref:hypothetical protein n=1 Tax=Actinomadura sp. NBRC 104412 TaxID=3032203 RepID=UPI0024A312C5|nr:hypothetical protein [Actinomadura sp. NBRC 104412]GLZ09402.1 hypothetical protein Acsp03_68680 [Actinomadura sp. NBRC 104412]